MTTIKFTELAQYQHVKFLKNLEKQARLSYNHVMREMLKAVKKSLRAQKLAKSDDFDNSKLGRGWTEEVPTIELDLEATVGKVVDDYLKALDWVMLGDYASPESKKMAKKLGMVGKVTPGLVPSAYLQSIDSHRQHHMEVLQETPAELPPNLLKESMRRIVKRTERFLKQTYQQIRNNTIQLVDRVVQTKNLNNLNEVFKEAHDNEPAVGGEEAVEQASKGLDDNVSTRAIAREFNKMAESFENKWQTVAQTEISTSSALGTHQSMYEIYGNSDDGVRVVWIEMEDERVCQFCKKASKKPDGTFKYYKLSDFKPSGANYGRKRSDWVLTIPPAHPRCRCDLVYVPRGFDVDKNGNLIKR